MSLIVRWVLIVLGVASLLFGPAGCAAMLGSDKSVEEQVQLVRGFAGIAKEFNLAFAATANLGGSPEAYAKTAFGLDTTVSGTVSLSLQADDPPGGGPAP